MSEKQPERTTVVLVDLQQPLHIALDYDLTYTRDPALWNQFIALARARGHEVFCVTGRDRVPEPHEPQFPGTYILCPGELKRRVTDSIRLRIDVWIDDMPGMIEPQRMLQW